MFSKADCKRVRALHQKKYRQEQQLFLVEGSKMVAELCANAHQFPLKALYYQEAEAARFEALLRTLPYPVEGALVTEAEMAQMTLLASPSPALAVSGWPTPEPFVPHPDGLYLVLDGVRDPGNLGTILRIADWFGLDGVVASEDSVERFNPKTIQATMGALFRVPIYYLDLVALLRDTDLPVYGTVLEGGQSMYDIPLQPHGYIVMGSESHGIRPELLPLMKTRLFIPAHRPGSESLNVAVATAVTCAAFRHPRVPSEPM